MLRTLIAFPVIFSFFLGYGQTNIEFVGETINFRADDGLSVTADLYVENDRSAPLILLFHQAGYSRGEYREIAPKLNAMGFNCLALDQRSGEEVNGVKNETHARAASAGKGTDYLDALPDLEASYLYVKHGLKPEKIILWGSSYSASLVLYLGSVHHDNISGIVAFAPGEYFRINGKSIEDYASKITAPVFISSAKDEFDNWKGIYKEIRSEKTYFLPENEGKHGSKALWSNNPGHELYWEALSNFLKKL